MPNVRYCDEKMGSVIESVFTSMKVLTVRERVHWAAAGIVTLKSEDFPEDLREDYRKFHRRVTALNGPDGSFKASADALTDSEARELLVLFANLAGAVVLRCAEL